MKWKKGDPRKYGVTTLKVITDESNHVIGVETAKCKTVKAPNGRLSFVPVEGSEERLDCQLILLAMGFVGPDVELFKSLGVETTFERGDK